MERNGVRFQVAPSANARDVPVGPPPPPRGKNQHESGKQNLRFQSVMVRTARSIRIGEEIFANYWRHYKLHIHVDGLLVEGVE